MPKATQEQTRQHNRRLILKTIYAQDTVSRADVARMTALTRTTVSNVVSGLIADGYVAEIGYGRSSGGKRPILLRVEDRARTMLAIDLGNSTLRGSVVDLRGELLSTHNVPVIGRKGPAVVALIYQLIDSLLAENKAPLLGIGIGAPGIIDSENGIISEAVNLGWHNLPLKELLETRYDLPVHIANDSDAAAMGEFTFGGKRDLKNIIVVKIGQGISAGIILNGQLYHGDNFAAGEIGHVTVVEQGERCSCGNLGCLETVAASQVLVNKAKQLAQQKDSLLLQYAVSIEVINTDTVLQAGRNGDQAVLAMVAEIGRYLGIVIAHLLAVLNVQHIVIAGRTARFGDALLQPIRQTMQQRVLPQIAAKTIISRSQLKQNIVVQGAAALLMSRELGLV